jgi:protein-L-isoaspartate(D-aspartate) O-methyltransferase
LRDRGAHRGHCRLHFQARLPRQFDEYIWFDESGAVTPLNTKELEGLPDTYPFGL